MSEKLKSSPSAAEATEGKRESSVSGIRAQVDSLAKKPSFRTEILTPENLTEKQIIDASRFFRYIFNNDWQEFVVCTDCDSKLPEGMRWSAMKVYGEDKHVPLSILDASPKLPDCPCCGQQMKIFHDPEKTYMNLHGKLSKDGYLTMLRDEQDESVSGFIFGYGTTLEEEFHYEWRNKYLYMAEEDPAYDRSLDKLVGLLNQHVPDRQFSRDMQLFCWNCVATDPKARGMSNFEKLMDGFFGSLPPEKRDQSIVGEVLRGSTAHKIFRLLKGIDVPGYLDGDDTIIVGHVDTIIERMRRLFR